MFLLSINKKGQYFFFISQAPLQNALGNRIASVGIRICRMMSESGFTGWMDLQNVLHPVNPKIPAILMQTISHAIVAEGIAEGPDFTYDLVGTHCRNQDFLDDWIFRILSGSGFAGWCLSSPSWNPGYPDSDILLLNTFFTCKLLLPKLSNKPTGSL